MGTGGVTITPRTPQHAVPRQARTTRGGPRNATSSFEADVHLLDYACGDGSANLSHAVVHLANFPRLNGRRVAWADGAVGAGRLLFEGAGWTVVLDPVQDRAEARKAVEGKRRVLPSPIPRRYVHVGGDIHQCGAADFIEAFTFFCWLCAEARCGPMLPVGYDNTGQARWARWSVTRTESFPSARTWLDSVHAGEAEALFPTFMARFGDPYWRRVLSHAISYLVEAGRPDTVERAIIMAQVLLEAVSYSWLVEERHLRTHDEFENERAASNIRAMLLDMKVPVAIPSSLPALAATRSRRGTQVDGPQALVFKRNDIIHRRRPEPVPSYDPLINAWRLGAWYSELVVLRVCGFNGRYRSRLSNNVWTGVVEPVPWS